VATRLRAAACEARLGFRLAIRLSEIVPFRSWAGLSSFGPRDPTSSGDVPRNIAARSPRTFAPFAATNGMVLVVQQPPADRTQPMRAESPRDCETDGIPRAY